MDAELRRFSHGSNHAFISPLSNYAPTIAIQLEALHKYNCQQVLWLYGPEHYLTEVGTMNIFMYWVNEQGGKFTPGLIYPSGNLAYAIISS